MDFAFTEDQLAITQAAREMLVERCTPADLRRLLASGEAIDTGRWNRIREIGLLSIMAPKVAGGLGLGLVDFVGIAEAAGYVALPEPLVELAGIVVPLLAELNDDRGWLARVLDGAIVAMEHSGWNMLVADADIADALLLHDSAEGEMHLVERQAVKLRREESFDPFRRLFAVDWHPTVSTLINHIDPERPIDSTPIVLGRQCSDAAHRGIVLAAAQLIGLGQRCIDMAVAYAKDRHQFGKPIGSYQAVKHLLATAQVAIEFARPVVHAAAAELPLANLAARARTAHAKIAAAKAADLAARAAVQVHGAMGMTWEVDVHFFLKRAFALKTAWGTPAEHLAQVIHRMRELPTGPEFTFASEC